MFAVIRRYRFDEKDSAEINRLIQDEFVPLIEEAQGFVHYYWLDTGAGEGASFGLFEEKAGADESVQLAAEFVRTKMASLLREKPQIIEGLIKAHDQRGTASSQLSALEPASPSAELAARRARR